MGERSAGPSTSHTQACPQPLHSPSCGLVGKTSQPSQDPARLRGRLEPFTTAGGARQSRLAQVPGGSTRTLRSGVEKGFG